MNAYEKRIMPICVGAIAIASLSIGLARAADTPQANPALSGETPVMVAQVTAAATVVAVESRMFPAHEARVRAAAAQGPEALRRYIQRTRMIWNFYYPDFALGQ